MMVEEYHLGHVDVLDLLVIDQMGVHYVLGMIGNEMTCENHNC